MIAQKKEELMTTTPAFLSPYQKRLELVQRIVREDTGLSEEQSRALAVHVLHTLDTLPETIR